MSVLIVSGIEGVANLAIAVEKQIGMQVKVAQGRRAALSALRSSEFVVVVVDETLVECDAETADALWGHAGLAVPLQINFATSGAARLVRDIRAALHRREHEKALARAAAQDAVNEEVRSTITGLLLHSELALTECKGIEPVASKLRIVTQLALNLRERLAVSREASAAQI